MAMMRNVDIVSATIWHVYKYKQ